MAELAMSHRESRISDEVGLLSEVLRENSERLRTVENEYWQLTAKQHASYARLGFWGAAVVVTMTAVTGLTAASLVSSTWLVASSVAVSCAVLVGALLDLSSASRLNRLVRVERANAEEYLEAIRAIAQRASQLEHRASLDETRKLILRLELAQAEGVLRRSEFITGVSPDELASPRKTSSRRRRSQEAVLPSTSANPRAS